MKRYALLFLLLSMWCKLCAAHSTGISYVSVIADTVQHQSVTIEVSLSLRDLDAVVNLDPDDNGQIIWGEVRRAQNDIARYIADNLHVSGATPCVLQPKSLLANSLAEGMYAVMRFDTSCTGAASLRVHSDLLFAVDPAQRTVLSVGQAGTHILTSQSRDWHGALTEPSWWRTLCEFIAEGMWHIWIGYDHLAFLLTLLLPVVLMPRIDHARSIGLSIVGVVTAFTVAHSITLGLAALGQVNLPSRPVEAAIAMSITLAGIANLFARTRHLGVATAFTFGLIHGFGFASALREVGDTIGDRSLALFGFNVGVEVGQLLIVLMAVPLLLALRRHHLMQRHALPALSLLTAALGLLWFCQRI